MKHCKDCKYFSKIENTEETNQGICTFTDYYSPVDINCDCPYIPEKSHKFTCGDCARLGYDDWCYTCREEDKACNIGFIDKLYDNLEQIVYQLLLQGRFDIDKINDVVMKTKDNFKTPLDEENKK